MDNNTNDNLKVNNNGKYNPYKDFLPENRVKKENNYNISKYGLVPFYLIFAVVLVVIFFWFNGKDVLTTKRVYNMNLSESINLDNVYSSSDVTWVSNNNSVSVKNNVVIANTSGKVYLYAKKDDKVVSDVTINVLNGSEALSIDNHAINTKVGDSKIITVTRNKLDKDNDDKEDKPSEILFNYIKGIVVKIFPDYDNNNDNNKSRDDINNPSSNNSNKESSNNNNYNGNGNNNESSLGNEYEDDSDYYDDSESYYGDEVYNDSIDSDDIDVDNSIDDDLIYKSTDESVVKVDDSGNIIPVAPGVAEIIVKDENGNEDHTVISVLEDDLIISNEQYTLNVNDSININYKLNSNNYSDDDIEWSSNDESICSVSSDGKITAVSVGETVIIAKVGNITKEIKVSVQDNIVLPSDINISTVSLGLFVGESQTVTASIMPSDAVHGELSWVSQDNEIATVENGLIIGKSLGNTIISVSTSNGITKNIEVNVTRKIVLPEIIEVDSNVLDMVEDEVKKVGYTLKPDGVTDKTVKVKYDPNYVTVDDNINVRALKPGSTLLTLITSNNKQVSIRINIKKSIIDLTKLSINKDKLQLTEGDSYKLDLIYSPVNASNKSVIWTSSNVNVATVDENGNVEGVSAGEAVINVKSKSNNNISSKIPVVVVKKVINVQKINIMENDFDLHVGSSEKLSVGFTPSNASNKGISWTSSNSKIATVDSNGKVTGLSKGKVIITATSKENNTIKDTISINVENIVKDISVTSINVNVTSLDLFVGKGYKINATVSPSNATNKDLIWSSSSSKVASVDKNGNVLALAVGNANIIVTSKSNNNIKVLIPIKVKNEVAVSSIKLDKKKINLIIGESSKLIATISPSNATNKNIVWTSSNSNVAKVDNKGNISASNVGEATIFAISSINNSIKDYCVVNVIIPVESIVLDKKSINLKVGETSKLTATIKPSNASNKSVRWVSSNTKVATVDNNGNVKAIGAGTTTIVSTSQDGTNKVSKATITVKKPDVLAKSISIVNAKGIVIGESMNLSAVVSPNNVTDKRVVWVSSDVKKATVDANGRVVGRGYGSVNITAKCGGKSVTKRITIYKGYFDVALLWGQSNMVGKAGRQAKELSTKNKLKNVDSDIVSNYISYSKVNVSIPKGVAYEYKALSNTLTDISTNPLKFGENISISNNRFVNGSILEQSSGTNMIPYFAKTYYNNTKHKLVIVHAAHDGAKIRAFLPHSNSRHIGSGSSDYIYESMSLKYKNAVNYLISQGYLVKNRFYVVYQGGADSKNIDTINDYYKDYLSVHKQLKKELNISFGSIIYAWQRNVDSKDGKNVKLINQQKKLISKNNDIILGTDYVYKQIINENFTIFCPKGNISHLNAAGLSQVGKKVASSIVNSKLIK